jgi:hypothetical protein
MVATDGVLRQKLSFSKPFLFVTDGLASLRGVVGLSIRGAAPYYLLWEVYMMQTSEPLSFSSAAQICASAMVKPRMSG